MVNNAHPDLDIGRDPRAVLTEFAVDRLHVIFSAHHRAVLRLIIAERERFPDLASLYYERGPQRSHGLLVEYLSALKRRTCWRRRSRRSRRILRRYADAPWYKELLLLRLPTPSDDALQQRAEHVVGRFLEAFHRKTH